MEASEVTSRSVRTAKDLTKDPKVEGYGPDLHNSIATIFFFKFGCLHMGKCFETISELLGSISCC